MLDGITYGDTKSEEQDLGDSEEGGTKYDIANGPSVIQGSEYKHQLRYNVDHCTDQRPKDVDDPQSDRLLEVESSDVLERRYCDEERKTKHDKAGYTKELSSKGDQ